MRTFNVLSSVSVISLAVLGSSASFANCPSFGPTGGTFITSDTTFSGACTSPATNNYVKWLSGTITSTGTIDGTRNDALFLKDTTGIGSFIVQSGSVLTNTSAEVISIGLWSNNPTNGDAVAITNSGAIRMSGVSVSGVAFGWGALSIFGNLGSLTNNAGAEITAVNNQQGAISVGSRGVIGLLSNAGTISGKKGIYTQAGGKITELTNSGSITGSNGPGIDNAGTITTLNSSGTVSGSTFGVANSGTITTLTNSGAITGSTAGITNSGTITTLNNSQGGDGSSPSKTPLTYTGALPTNYNIGVVSKTQYGQVNFVNPTGTTTIGVSSLTGVGLRGTYSNLVSGLSSTNLTSTAAISGSSGKYNYTLTWNGTGYTMTLVQFMPDASATLRNLSTNQSAVNSVLVQRQAVITNALNYDCGTFDSNNLCVSFQARYTGFDGMNQGGGVLTLAYRLAQGFRIGAFIDYAANPNNPTGISQGQPLPTFGAFVGYNNRNDNTGLQARVAAAFNQGNLRITRPGIDDETGFAQAGSGKANLNNYGIGGEVGWGIAIAPTTIVTPFVGLRYNNSARGSYTEGLIPDVVTYPLSYSSYQQIATTASVGGRLSGLVTDKIGYQLAAAIDYIIMLDQGVYAGTSSISDLSSFALIGNSSGSRWKPAAAAGLYYQIDPTQRLTSNVIVRTLPFSSEPSVTAMAGYQKAF